MSATYGIRELKALFQACFVFICVLLWAQQVPGEQNGLITGIDRQNAPASFRFIVGDRTTYRFTFKSSSFSDLSVLLVGGRSSDTQRKEQPSGLAFSFKTKVRGELKATVIEKRAEGFLVAYSLQAPLVILISDGQDAADQAQDIREDLSKDIFALISPEGKILSVRFDPAVGSLSQSYARALLALTQFVLPAGQLPVTGRWETQEDDPNGQYIAEYRILKSKDKKVTVPPLMTVRKKKIRYLTPQQQPRMGKIEVPVTVQPKGELSARYDFAKGALYSLSGSESQDILMNKKRIGYGTINIKMSFSRNEILDTAAFMLLKEAYAAREKAVAAVPLSVKPSPEERQMAIQQKELGNATLESLLTELKKAESATDAEFKSTPLYLKFKALIYLHPESCETLGRVLSDAGSKSLTMGILPMALGTVGHAQAQSALIEAIKSHSRDKLALSTLIQALATVDESTEEAEAALRGFAFNSPDPEISSMARLALGAQARNLSKTSPARAAKIVESLLDAIKSSPSPKVTRQLLLSLGNAGSPHALPEISRFASDASPGLRGAAARALRFIDSPEAETLLITMLSSDPESSVRQESAFSLGFRKMTQATFQAQKEAFAKERVIAIRLKLLDNLWKSHGDFPEVRGIVKEVASKDASKDVRKAAANIMSQHPRRYFK